MKADGPGLIGQRVGPYLIEELIGAGGMGVEHAARDNVFMQFYQMLSDVAPRK